MDLKAAAVWLWMAGVALGPARADVFDAPSEFYNGVNGTGSMLERQLRDRMSRGHIQRRYGDLRFSSAVTDADPDRLGNILLAYTRESVRGRWIRG